MNSFYLKEEKNKSVKRRRDSFCSKIYVPEKPPSFLRLVRRNSCQTTKDRPEFPSKHSQRRVILRQQNGEPSCFLATFHYPRHTNTSSVPRFPDALTRESRKRGGVGNPLPFRYRVSRPVETRPRRIFTHRDHSDHETFPIRIAKIFQILLRLLRGKNFRKIEWFLASSFFRNVSNQDSTRPVISILQFLGLQPIASVLLSL